MNIFLDIETIPTSRPDVRERIAAEVVPKHKNGHVITDEAKAAAWWVEHGQDAIDHEVHRTALDGGLGEIVCICAAADNEPIEHWHRIPGVDSAKAWHGDRTMLGQFFDWLITVSKAWPTFIGHNIGFDLKFLWRRAVVLKVRPPAPIPYDAPPWKDAYVDTMQMWAGADPRDRVELTRLCEALGIEVDDDIDGSQVWERWQAGDIDTIVNHCRTDVERVRECYRRMMFL